MSLLAKASAPLVSGSPSEGASVKEPDQRASRFLPNLIGLAASSMSHSEENNRTDFHRFLISTTGASIVQQVCSSQPQHIRRRSQG